MRAANLESWRAPALLTLGVVALIAILAYSGRFFGVGATLSASPVPIRVAFPVAFLGGVLALLSPCSGAIVPAFFAYSFRSSGKLLQQTYVFFLGLSLVFVPLGFASSLLANVFASNANVFYVIGGVLLIVLGLATLLDLDVFDRFARLAAPGQQAMAKTKSDTARVFTFGAIFGFATSSCTAPLLGAMATLAVGTGGQSLVAILLFLTFALGIAAPLFVLAAVFERYDVARKSWLQREVSLAGRSIPVTRLLTGLVLVALGIVFLALQGTVGLNSIYDRFGASETYARWTNTIGRAFDAVPLSGSLLIALAMIGGGGWLLARFARGRPR